MAAGWAELLKWIRRRVAAKERDPEATWTRFQKLAARSQRSEILERIVRVGRVLPSEERYQLAVAMTRLLAPIEWPGEWSEARLGLVAALATLVQETDSSAEASFFALHDLGEDTLLLNLGCALLANAVVLLSGPCRREDLRTVARVCSLGNHGCRVVYRKAIQRAGGTAVVNQNARERYRSAVEAYAQAARALNEATGSVLFEGLDAPIP